MNTEGLVKDFSPLILKLRQDLLDNNIYYDRFEDDIIDFFACELKNHSDKSRFFYIDIYKDLINDTRFNISTILEDYVERQFKDNDYKRNILHFSNLLAKSDLEDLDYNLLDFVIVNDRVLKDIGLIVDDMLNASEDDHYLYLNSITRNRTFTYLIEFYCYSNDIELLDISNVKGMKTEDFDYIKCIKKIPLLSIEETNELIKLYRETNDVSIRNRIVEANLRLALSVASKFMTCGLDFNDLIQIANVALINCVEEYDPSKGKLSTYAYSAIRRGIMSEVTYDRTGIKSPYASLQYKQINIFKEDFEKEKGRTPTISEISEGTSIKPERVRELVNPPRASISLNDTFASDTNGDSIESTLIDFIEDKDVDVLEEIERRGTVEFIKYLLDNSNLTEKQKFAIMYRNGFYDEKGLPQTLGDTSKKMDSTREWARVCEMKALDKLRKTILLKSEEKPLGFDTEKIKKLVYPDDD